MDNEEKVKLPEFTFTGENIPVKVAAKIMDKDQQFVRQALIRGLLPIGLAIKVTGEKSYSYYISPKLFYEYTGYAYKPVKLNSVEDED